MKTSLITELWRTKIYFTLTLTLAVSGLWVAPTDWQRGLMLGLYLGCVLAGLGRAVRRARACVALP